LAPEDLLSSGFEHLLSGLQFPLLDVESPLLSLQLVAVC
jgi:hypothetical protein